MTAFVRIEDHEFAVPGETWQEREARQAASLARGLAALHARVGHVEPDRRDPGDQEQP